MQLIDQLCVCLVLLVSIGVIAPMSIGLLNSNGFVVDSSSDFWSQQVMSKRMSTSYATAQVRT